MSQSLFSIDHKVLQAVKPGVKGIIKATDQVDLAYHAYIPNHPRSCIIFYHGGGANNLDYTKMAQFLCDKYQVATFLFDIRGHGQSGGIRGYSPSKEQVWADINSAIQLVKKKFSNIPLHIGGHSSGAGLVLNYSSWDQRESISGYFMVAPEFGYHIAAQKLKFAEVNCFTFLLNILSKNYLCSKTLAVRFNYPDELIKTYGFLLGYTVNMAKAVTPYDPLAQLKKIHSPLFIFLAEDDELIDNQKLGTILSAATKENTYINVKSVPHAKHIMILENVHLYIGPHLL